MKDNFKTTKLVKKCLQRHLKCSNETPKLSIETVTRYNWLLWKFYLKGVFTWNTGIHNVA